ncbi:hypothetical protein WMC41_16255 [Shinella yambaruensis]|uniref:hypothetical protein n=1 Tax=Shinella yambaruensis TaxID=415996 RepID=UPI003D78F595
MGVPNFGETTERNFAPSEIKGIALGLILSRAFSRGWRRPTQNCVGQNRSMLRIFQSFEFAKFGISPPRTKRKNRPPGEASG